MKRTVAALLAISLAIVGCRSIRVEKHDPVVTQISTNEWIVASGGWEAKYWSYCTFTSFGELGIGIETNGTVSVRLSDLHSDMSTNCVKIVVAGGESAGEIAKKIIEALK